MEATDPEALAKKDQHDQEHKLYRMSRPQFREFLERHPKEVQDELKKMRRRVGHRMAKRRQRQRQRQQDSGSDAHEYAAVLRGHIAAALKHLEAVFLVAIADEAKPPR